MISELFDYFRSSAPKILKDLGYVYSSIALERRARRQSKAWAEHIENCHILWRDILKDSQYKKIAVIGSGPLTETPMSSILDHCDELHLVDIVQPRTLKKKWGRHPKVYLHEQDVTGAVDWMASAKAQLPSSFNFKSPFPNIKADLVVSANLLSQLSLEPTWHMTKKYEVPADSLFIKEFIHKINLDHLEYLGRYRAKKVILYTDMKREYISPGGEVLEVHDSYVVPESQIGQKIKSWRWKLCPLGEESKDYEIQMLVAAFDLVNRGPC